jgi:hypothetical protein
MVSAASGGCTSLTAMTVRLASLATACMLLIPLTWATAASAEPYVERKGFHADLTLKASNGYTVWVGARGNGRVTLTAIDSGLHNSWALIAEYRTTGRVTGDEIVARFGRLGRISIALDPDAETRSGPGIFPESYCRGRDRIIREGAWHGRIAFRGERGFTRVVASHAAGKTVRSFRRVCGPPSKPRQRVRRSAEPQRTIHLQATRRTAGRRLEFDAMAGNGELPLIFHAEARERREGIAIQRSAFALADPDLFAVSAAGERPRWAKASPPTPFKGWAVFREGANRRSAWTGTLRTPLPGLGTVNLTGQQFRASICEAEKDLFYEECEEG